MITPMIHGSDKVMAPFGEVGIFYRGKWENVKVTQVGPDKDTPLEVRKSLVGLVIPTIFTKEDIEKQTKSTFPIPKDSRLAYASDVIEILKSSGKNEAANQLKKITPDFLDMYILEKDIYELVQ